MHVIEDARQIEQLLKERLGDNYPTRLTWRPEDFAKQLKDSQRTQAELAKQTGIKQPTISELKTGKVQYRKRAVSNGDSDSEPTEERPSKDIALLYALAVALGCELEDFADVPQHCGRAITAVQIRALQPRLLEVEGVRTLLQPGAKIRLRDIYYRTKLVERSHFWNPADIEQDKGGPAIQIDVLNDLPQQACVVLGMAGQGKSIFLRYLTIQAALSEAVLPLFFELRLWDTEPVWEQLFRKLSNLGLIQNEADLENVLKTGQVALLFDAFDELEPARRQRFLIELGHLRDAYPQTRIILTARPESGILSCDWLHPYSIAPLERGDVETLIRIYSDPAEADAMLHQLKCARNEVMALLAAPIFIALVVMKFRHTRSIPQNLTEFYRDLFDALVRRHNEDVGGLRRGIESGLIPYQLEKAFQQIAYVVHHDFGDRPPHIRQVEDVTMLVANGLPQPIAMPPLILSDIMRVTNLILEEAGSCYFLHKSVREYYAAAFIAGQPADVAKRAYERIARRWEDWRHVLTLLAELDGDRMAVYFELPLLEQLLQGGRLAYLKQFTTFLLVKTEVNQEQLHIMGGTEFCAQHHRVVLGSIFQGYVRKGFQQWCPKLTFPELDASRPLRIPNDQIDFPALLDWLGDSLTESYQACEQRLAECRQIAQQMQAGG